MSQEQTQIESLIAKLIEAETPYEIIIEILCSIIKQQMLYGGTLVDKINYEIHLAQRIIDQK